MLDRASSFADPTVIARLREHFVPVAVDEWYHVRQQDAEGELYRKIVFQRDGMTPGRTTQGFYLAEPDGTLVHGWNHRDAGRLRDLLTKHLATGKPEASPATGADSAAAVDPTFARTPPAGGLVVAVFTRVLEARWPEVEHPEWHRPFREGLGRDHLWVTGPEADALARGHWPETLGTRIARFHLIDNSRGEPPMWRAREVWQADFTMEPAGDGRFVVRGEARAQAPAGDGAPARGYHLRLRGEVRVKDGKVTGFDLVAKGSYHGHGRYTGNHAPIGPFSLGIAFALARPDDVAARVPPQGSRELRDYLGR